MRYADSRCVCNESFENGKHTYTFTGPCFHTGKPYSVSVPAAGLFKYRNGAYIQDAFPEVSKEDREFLMSGYSPEGWKQLFGSLEDFEDEEDSDRQSLVVHRGNMKTINKKEFSKVIIKLCKFGVDGRPTNTIDRSIMQYCHQGKLLAQAIYPKGLSPRYEVHEENLNDFYGMPTC